MFYLKIIIIKEQVCYIFLNKIFDIVYKYVLTYNVLVKKVHCLLSKSLVIASEYQGQYYQG